MLEKHLHSRTFLVGHAATLADIVGVCNLYFGYTKVPEAVPSMAGPTRIWIASGQVLPAFARCGSTGDTLREELRSALDAAGV